MARRILLRPLLGRLTASPIFPEPGLSAAAVVAVAARAAQHKPRVRLLLHLLLMEHLRVEAGLGLPGLQVDLQPADLLRPDRAEPGFVILRLSPTDHRWHRFRTSPRDFQDVSRH